MSSTPGVESRRERGSLNGSAGFTLLEMLTAIAVLLLILMLVLGMVNHTSALWRFTEGRSKAYQEARNAFQRLTSSLSQAKLNPYLDYDNPLSPNRYVRRSELHFITGPVTELVPQAAAAGHAVFFVAPLGSTDLAQLRELGCLLAGAGYFVAWDDDRSSLPSFLQPGTVGSRPRFVLKEFRQPAENLDIYGIFRGGSDPKEWFAGPLSVPVLGHSTTLAENVVFFSVNPVSSNGQGGVPITTDFRYDSRAWWTGAGSPPAGSQPVESHQLPPVLEVTMVVLDEKSALAAARGLSTPPQLVPTGLFENPADFATDLRAFEKALTDRNLKYWVFSARVPIKASKWD